MRAERPMWLHRIVRIVQNVEENLLQLLRVSHNFRQALIEMLDDFDTVAVEIVRAELNGAAQD